MITENKLKDENLIKPREHGKQHKHACTHMTTGIRSNYYQSQLMSLGQIHILEGRDTKKLINFLKRAETFKLDL